MHIFKCLQQSPAFSPVTLCGEGAFAFKIDVIDQRITTVRRGRNAAKLPLDIVALARRGFNALWLIGVWERSKASQRIKQLTGNPEAAASAYSLFAELFHLRRILVAQEFRA